MKTRFCPSPTGNMHLGNARTALFNALFAHQTDGDFLLRIEDTDPERSRPEFTESIQQDLQWLGCAWQEGPGQDQGNGPYFQAQRMDVYERYYDYLRENDLSYPCFATEEELSLMRKIQRTAGKPPRYDGRYANLSEEERAAKIAEGIPYSIRIRVPDDAVIEYVDVIKGPQKFLGKDIGDFIIRRQDGMPTFMFCNAIDDSLMGVTHALRGEDHLTNTPRQLHILRTLDMREPEYGHFSLLTASHGGKLSKRDGAFSLQDMRAQGYLPLALANYMARLSHRYQSDDLLPWKELAHHFDSNTFSRSSAKFDSKQLEHWQKLAVAALSADEAKAWLADAVADVEDPSWSDFWSLLQPNIVFPSEAATWVQALYADSVEFTDEQNTLLKDTGVEFFQAAKAALAEHGNDAKAMLNSIKETCGVKGKGLFMPFRVAITAHNHGPDLAPLLQLMSVDTINQRLDQVIQYVTNL